MYKVYYYPAYPIYYKINYIHSHLGLIQTQRRKADFYIWWRDESHFGYCPDILNDKFCVNRNVTCIDKDFVDERVEKYFGFKTGIDPRTFNDPYVEKSIKNATHDGVVLKKNKEPVKGKFYQLDVDTYNGHSYVDYRIPIIFGRIPFVIIKYKNTKFGGGVSGNVIGIELKPPRSIFSEEWLNNFIEFCNGYIDYGEIDVLNQYVIDVNNTPSAVMYRNLTEQQKTEFTKKCSDLFLIGLRERL